MSTGQESSSAVGTGSSTASHQRTTDLLTQGRARYFTLISTSTENVEELKKTVRNDRELRDLLKQAALESDKAVTWNIAAKFKKRWHDTWRNEALSLKKINDVENAALDFKAKEIA
jgi:hypothetical protein